MKLSGTMGGGTFCKQWIFFILLFCCFLPHAAMTSSSPTALVDNGGYVVSMTGNRIAKYNSNTPFIPASTIKILTSLLALDILGENYRFTTSIYRDKNNNLYIKGGGDPFLTSENIETLVHQLHVSGLTSVNNIFLDDSDYQLDSLTDGSENSANPYDVPNGALAANFNTIAIQVGNSTICSSEAQTPTLPLTINIGKNLPQGKHRININNFSLNNTALQYVGELFTAFLQKENIPITGGIKTGSIPKKIELFFEYKSAKTVDQMIRECLQYSNNFIANQLFLEAGKKQFGPPATWRKSRQTMNNYLESIPDLPSPLPTIVEGSGLSRKNRITAAQLMVFTELFTTHATRLMPQKHGIYVKSGTMTGIYCYAGFIPVSSGLAPFVILLNQPENNRDQLLQFLKQQTARQ